MNGGMSIVPMVLHSLWVALQSVTGIAGVTPLDLGYGIGGIILLILSIGVVQAVRGKTSFSLEEKDSEWAA